MSAAFEFDLAFRGDPSKRSKSKAADKSVRPTRHTRSSGLLNVWRQLTDQKFFDEIGARGRADSDGAAFEGQSHSIAVLLRIIEIRDRACGQISADARIIRLPASVVAFADHGIGDRVQNPRPLAAGAFVEIARILFQKGGQDGAADVRAGNEVGVGGAVALAISLAP